MSSIPARTCASWTYGSVEYCVSGTRYQLLQSRLTVCPHHNFANVSAIIFPQPPKLSCRCRTCRIEEIPPELCQRVRCVEASVGHRTGHPSDPRRDERHCPTPVRKDYVDVAVASSLTGEEKILHGADRVKSKLAHRNWISYRCTPTPRGIWVDKNTCVSAVETIEYWVQGSVAQIGPVRIGV